MGLFPMYLIVGTLSLSEKGVLIMSTYSLSMKESWRN
jgi:hypothetical protein